MPEVSFVRGTLGKVAEQPGGLARRGAGPRAGGFGGFVV